MKKLLFFLSLLIASSGVFAQHRSEQEAILIAKNFFKPAMKKTKLAVVPQQRVQAKLANMAKGTKRASTSQNSSYYIINDEANNRFVIVSADERMYKILGYSNNGMFDIDKAPEGLLFVLNGYREQYDNMLAGKVRFLSEHEEKKYEEIPYFLQTEWGQGEPYNLQCPDDPNGGKCVTGCVATAMAQVMKYYNHPSQGFGKMSYTSSPYGFNLAVDYSTFQFDWDNMPNKLTDNWNEEQKSAVSRLMYACGTSVAMQYTASGSGANPGNCAYALINYFDYNPNIKYYYRDYFTKQEWDSIIVKNLENKRPVIYGGSGEDGGHEFIIDGRNEDGLFHINWGWNGTYNDGFFELIALTPGKYDFSLGQSMVCNITPEKESITDDNDFYSTIFLPNDWINSVKVGSYTKSTFSRLMCCGSSYNSYNQHFNGYIGVGVFDKDFNFIKSLTQFSANIYSGAWYEDDITTFIYKYDASLFTEGSQYYLAPYSVEKGTSTYKLIRTTGGAFDWYLATVEDGVVKLNLKGEIKPDIPDGLVGTFDVKALDNNDVMKYWQVSVTRENNSNKYIFQGIDPVISGGDNMVFGYMNETGQIFIPISEQKELSSNCYIHSYTSPDNIIVRINWDNSTMKIDGTWGTVERTGSGDNINQTNLSYYKDATFSYPSAPIPVETPVITFSDGHQMTISCATDGAEIYYTLSDNGSDPNKQSIRYNTPITLTENAIVKAIAYKDNSASEIASRKYEEFIVATPLFTTNGNKVTISCETPGVSIFYTLDGTTPSTSSNEYTQEGITCNSTTIITAIALRKNWKDSPIANYQFIIPEADIVVENNIAGNLPSTISAAEKISSTGLYVSGELNGTDIKFIREMLTEGTLKYLDIKNSSIVGGGEPYYETTTSKYTTENNVIGDYMFTESANLLSIKLPSEAKVLGRNALSHCEKLVELELPEACEKIETFSIYYCKNIESITLPKSVKEFDGMNGIGCLKLKEINVANDNPYFKSVEGVLYTKDEATLVKFPRAKNSTSYSVLAQTKTIENHAFENTLIENIELPSTLTNIERYAFESCENLEYVEIPNSVTAIGSGAFSHCKKLKAVVISDNVKSLESFVFSYCTNLREFHVGKNLASIDPHAFNNCASLQKFIVDEENQTFCVYNNSLYSKDMQELILCPRGYYSEEYIIPDGVNIIESRAFADCKNVKSFLLPQTVTTIKGSAFENCAMKSISIPNSVILIEDAALNGCDSLESVILPSNLNRIEDRLLTSCRKLSYLYLPATIDYIGSRAFAYCRSLSTIYCEIEDIEKVEFYTSTYSPNVESFLDIPDTCTWHIPYGCTEKYKAQSWWVPTWRILEIYENSLTAQDVRITAGDKVILPIIMDNDNDIRSLQFDMKLPQGVSVVYDESEGEYLADLTSERGTKNHILDCAKLKNGNYRFVVSTSKLSNLNGHEGILANITLAVDEDLEGDKDYDIYLTNIELTAVQEDGTLKAVRPNDSKAKLTVSSYMWGDVNGDLKVTITDAGLIVNALLEKYSDEFNEKAADTNGDGTISITDAAEIINYILGNGEAGNKAKIKIIMQANEDF